MTVPYTVDLDKRVHAAIAPLFATDMLLRDGHTDAALNGTVTFVRRGGRIFALTCHHVLEAFRAEALRRNHVLAPSVHVGRSLVQFKAYLGTSIRWTFRSCRDFPDEALLEDADALKDFNGMNSSRADIAIADVPEEAWDVFSRERPLEPIDLDNWIEPRWEQLGRFWAAYGFPNGHKYRSGDKVAAPMPRITVKLQSLSPQHREDFTLYSELDGEHCFGFSGISGGPVLAESEVDQCFHFTGLVFEGSPSTTEPVSSDEAFLGATAIYLRCYLLTPESFDRWQRAAKYGVQLELGCRT